MNFLVIDQNEVGRQQGPANYCHIVSKSFHLVCGVLVHEFAHWKVKYLFHFTLLEELIEHGLHPLEKDGGSSHNLEVVADTNRDT